jgi:hypothetical protein
LLSGLVASDEEEVDCPAWNRWQSTLNPLTSEAIPRITVKEWLQQTTMPTVHLQNTLDAKRLKVQIDGKTALQNATSQLKPKADANQPSVPEDLELKCYNRRKWKYDITKIPVGATEIEEYENIQHMVYSTYNSGMDMFASKFARCAPSLSGCIETVRSSHTPVEPLQENPVLPVTGIVSILSKWLFDDFVYGDMVAWVSEEELLLSKVPQWGDADLNLFSQPWLHMDAISEPFISNSLDEALNKAYPDHFKDRCVVYNRRDVDFEATLEPGKERCIYKNNQDSDPLSNFYPQKEDYSAKVSLWHGNSAMDFEERAEVMEICKTGSPLGTDTATNFLHQKCYLGMNKPGMTSTHTTPVTEGYQCRPVDRGNGVIGCKDATAENPVLIENPHPERVCYELGNDCFNRDGTSEFSRNAEYTWHKAHLPPGVRLITYSYPYEPSRILGRNPMYQGSREKLIWNQTLFDRQDVIRRIADLKVKTLKKLFATPIAQARFTQPAPPPPSARRLLQAGGFNVTPEEFDNTNSTMSGQGDSSASRQLLQWSAHYPEWVMHEKCGPGWVWKVDALATEMPARNGKPDHVHTLDPWTSTQEQVKELIKLSGTPHGSTVMCQASLQAKG